MSGAPYTGDGSAITPHAATTITVPVDGDPDNAATFTIGTEKIADFVAYLMTNAVLKGAIEKTILSGAPSGPDDSAVLSSVPVVGTRRLLWEIQPSGGTYLARLYLLATGELEITHDAKWRPGTNDWIADSYAIGADSVKVVFGKLGLRVYRFTPTAPTGNVWADAAWVLVGNLGNDGLLKFLHTTTGASGSNPPATTAIANQVCAKNTCKAWARVQISSGAPVVIGGFNVASVALAVGNLAVQVNFAQAMADANYAAVATGQVLPAGILAQGTGSVQVFLYDNSNMAAGPKDLSAYTGDFTLVVFGQQDT